MVCPHVGRALPFRLVEKEAKTAKGGRESGLWECGGGFIAGGAWVFLFLLGCFAQGRLDSSCLFFLKHQKIVGWVHIVLQKGAVRWNLHAFYITWLPEKPPQARPDRRSGQIAGSGDRRHGIA